MDSGTAHEWLVVAIIRLCMVNAQGVQICAAAEINFSTQPARCSLTAGSACMTAPGSAQKRGGPLTGTMRRQERLCSRASAATAWRAARQRRHSRQPTGRAGRWPQGLGCRMSIAAKPARWRAEAAAGDPAPSTQTNHKNVLQDATQPPPEDAIHNIFKILPQCAL